MAILSVEVVKAGTYLGGFGEEKKDQVLAFCVFWLKLFLGTS